MGNYMSAEAETVSKFDEVQQHKREPWTSSSLEALQVVNDDDCAICAAASRIIYEGESIYFDSMEDALREKGFTILRKVFFDGKLDEDHTEETHPPMASLVYKRSSGGSGATMLFVFRGTATEYDWAANIDAPPIPSPLWHNEWPHIKVHKGWVGEIWRYFSDYCGIGEDGITPRPRVDGGDRVPDLLKKYNVTKILFSGHSLGGALAQIASLAGMLMVQKMREQDREIPEVQLRSFTFAAPMPFYFKTEELTEQERDVLNDFRRICYNVVFDLDVIPHQFGHPDWVRRMSPDLREAVEYAVKSNIPSVIPWSFIKAFVQPCTEKIAQMSLKHSNNLKKYKHVSMIVHFDLNHAKSLATFNAFSVKIMTPEEFGALDYPFASKDGCFKALLGVPAHTVLPDTIVHGSFRSLRIVSQSDNNNDKDNSEEKEDCEVDDDEKKGDDIMLDDKEESLVVLGGRGGSRKDCWNSVEKHNTTTEHDFMSAGSMQRKRHGASAAVLGKQLYVVGGHNGESFLSSVERYDPTVGSWSLLRTQMLTCRAGCAAAAVDGRLYVVGGMEDMNKTLDSVEVYDPGTEAWSKVASMGSKRSGCCAVSMSGELYVIGGTLGSSHLNSGEVYNPVKDEWAPLPAVMRSKRAGCAAAVLSGKLFVAGGYDGLSRLNGVEIYDPIAGTWSYLPKPMHSKREGCSAAVMGGRLFVAGGYNATESYLDTVEVYDPSTEEWTLLKMGSRRHGCAAAVVGGPGRNANESKESS